MGRTTLPDSGVATFDLLFDAHFAELVHLAHCLLDDPVRAQAVAMEAFLALHVRVSHLDDPAAALHDVRRAVISRSRPSLRERLRAKVAPRGRALSGRAAPRSGDLEPGGDAPLDVAPRMSPVAALRGLPLPEREVLACRYLLELSVSGTAALLETGQSWVERHERRGRAHLAARTGSPAETIDDIALSDTILAAAWVPITDADLADARRRLAARVEARHRHRVRAAVAAMAAAILVAGGGVSWLAMRSGTSAFEPRPDSSATTSREPTQDRPDTPAEAFVPTVGLIGIPLVGITASDTRRSALLETYRLFGAGMPFRGSVRLYADGRLIWYLLYGDSNEQSSGYVEQRLTPEGARLVHEHARGIERDPWHIPDWLPTRYWANQTPGPFVPSAFAFCVGVIDTAGPPPTADLQQFPAVVQTALQAGAGTAPPGSPDPGACIRVGTAEARRLATALRMAGFTENTDYLEAYNRRLTPSTTARLHAIFEPVFPDGSVGCSACG